MTDEKSLSDLMSEAYYLSLDCAFSELSPRGTYFTAREDLSEKENDLVFGWADGLTGKYYQNMTTGRCSLSAMVNFDIEKFEKTVIEDINKLKSILARVGKPITLTREEMRKRGYRGKDAGYSEKEDKEFYLTETKQRLAETKDKLKEFNKLLKKEQSYYGRWELEEDIREYEKRIKELEEELINLA